MMQGSTVGCYPVNYRHNGTLTQHKRSYLLDHAINGLSSSPVVTHKQAKRPKRAAKPFPMAAILCCVWSCDDDVTECY